MLGKEAVRPRSLTFGAKDKFAGMESPALKQKKIGEIKRIGCVE